MKHLSKTVKKILVALAFVTILPLAAIAQPDPGGDPDAPIDGGVTLLIAVGIGYGAKKVYDSRKKAR